jgi:AcrR family transcriptional regulator
VLPLEDLVAHDRDRRARTGPDGLRERKKQRTRQEISDVATALFADRGFEAVTLAEIADASSVSVKTVLNYFGTKEDLFFDRFDELRLGLVVTVRERPSGTTVLGALRALLVDNLVPFPGAGWKHLSDPEARRAYTRFAETEQRSPALRARRRLFGTVLAADLEHLLGEQLPAGTRPPTVAALAAMVVAAVEVRQQVLERQLLSASSAVTVRRHVVAAVTECFDRLETAFADVDRPAVPRAG